jgi:hypothetical protein
MSLQIQVQKNLEKINFLESTVYDKYDLTDLVKKDEKFMVRQGDLVITNYLISYKRKRGLTSAWLHKCNNKHSNIDSNIWVFGNNHFVIDANNETILVHPEHGITVIPIPMHQLNFYTFNQAKD